MFKSKPGIIILTKIVKIFKRTLTNKIYHILLNSLSTEIYLVNQPQRWKGNEIE